MKVVISLSSAITQPRTMATMLVAPLLSSVMATMLVAPLLSSVMASPLSGSPQSVPTDVDCGLRHLAYQYGQNLLPERGSFRSLFDALQLQRCNQTVPSSLDHWTPPTYTSPSNALHVSTSGNDAAAGTASEPFASISRALEAASGTKNATIVVHAGEYQVDEPLRITAAHSGLTLQNFEGDEVSVSGGVRFEVPRSAWRPYKQRVAWETSPSVNNVYGQVGPGADGEGIVFLGVTPSAVACEAAAKADGQRRGPFTAWTYHDPDFDDSVRQLDTRAAGGAGYARMCYARTDGAWAPVPQAHVRSGQLVRQNVWMADLSSHAAVGKLADGTMPGLRVDGRRAMCGAEARIDLRA